VSEARMDRAIPRDSDKIPGAEAAGGRGKARAVDKASKAEDIR